MNFNFGYFIGYKNFQYSISEIDAHKSHTIAMKNEHTRRIIMKIKYSYLIADSYIYTKPFDMLNLIYIGLI